jgi:hypothetical protein
MKVIPNSKTKPDKITCRLSCINQYKKNKAFKMRNNGKMSVSTDNSGNNFGAKNGKA